MPKLPAVNWPPRETRWIKFLQIQADVVGRKKKISATDAITQMTPAPALGLTPGTASLILKLSDLRSARIDASAISLVDGQPCAPQFKPTTQTA